MPKVLKCASSHPPYQAGGEPHLFSLLPSEIYVRVCNLNYLRFVGFYNGNIVADQKEWTLAARRKCLGNLFPSVPLGMNAISRYAYIVAYSRNSLAGWTEDLNGSVTF